MREVNLEKVIYQMLELKLLEIRLQIRQVTIENLYNYISNVILKNNRIRDVNDASFYIMNIKINKLFEYLNYETIKDESSTIEMDLKQILEG
ncbi:hypothetical protein SHELI_v1c03930 [Spiroplasma helicoides]|uniref:Uncharacterized protein n=1 Tax=Spiroplasma helicoides TaxID=216938 RepID=A0A1B3SK81_9MOLU|nr:hypothetical protein [Spiroplasma helicoides]AOG60344.1 hypothetical protein SHELI_v1c03930 [Spiroplasma helicoides]